MPAITPLDNNSNTADEHGVFNTSYIFLICAVVSLGGILFGFDLSIISGTVSYFKTYYVLDEFYTGWAVGSINLGAVIGAMIAGKMSDRYGRKNTLLICALLFAVSGVATGWATNFSLFVIARMLSGVAVGIAALVCPMYIAEIAPSKYRGTLVTFYQLSIVTGILLAYITNYFLLNIGEDNWRWMFTSQSLPAIAFFIGLLFVAESPRWLVRKNKNEKAIIIMSRIGGLTYAEDQNKRIKLSFANELTEKFSDLKSAGIRPILILGVLVAIFSQLVGQNSIFSYAPEIFKAAGAAEDSAFLQSIILGGTFFLATWVAILGIEKIGRKKLLISGALLLGIDSLALSLAFYFALPSMVILILVLLFIAIYGATLGPVTWVVLSEIFPNRVRGNAMALATLSLWIANFFTTAAFPVMQFNLGLAATFAIHGGICVLYFVIIKSKMPETKGKSLEEIEAQLTLE